MFSIQCEESRIKNQPFDSTSCNDSALRLLVLVTVFQYSKMSFQSMNSTLKPFKLTFVKASSVLRLSLVLLLLLTQFYLKKPRLENQIQELNRHLDIVGNILANHINMTNPQPTIITQQNQYIPMIKKLHSALPFLKVRPTAIVQATIVDLEYLRNILGDESFNKYAKC